ncbi:MAG: hypothetical protein NAG76_21740 [Candidatus Pristimantibacillus lignocellulolyticus]|uniref:Uncharacterized protein n=1 Tax=Candidatus Pristimantibacillus lignocellulolyticus TaxID=2994561 RepID=A0A9J6ZF43_9BACL|nr:MAG: hypothetical protein NAG76_21740 [Candidatus Pristimantibacillus lignocellulolyticus]
MRNKKLAKLLPLIFFVELLAFHLIDSLYYGVIKTWLFDIAIIPLLLCFVLIKKFGKVIFIGFIVLLVLIPFLFIFNLPSTTYEGGKAIVQNEINSDEVTFISTDYKKIPTTPLKSWFIDDYYYHYEVEVSGDKLYYVVIPINGFSFQLEEDFFRYDR